MPLPPNRTTDDALGGLTSLRYWLRVLHVMERRQIETLYQQWEADSRRRDGGDGDSPIPLHKESQIHVWITAHTLALAMRHVAVRLRRLQSWEALPPEASDPTHRYLRLYESEDLKDLRDALEHSDQYETGGGDHRDRIVVRDTGWLPGVAWHVRRVDESDTYTHLLGSISIFGREYSVEAILDAAHDVATALGVFDETQRQRPNDEASN